MDQRWLIWDVAAVLLIIFVVWRAAKRGLLRTLLSLAGGVIAAVAAGILSLPLAQFLYDAVVRDAVRAVISRQLSAALEGGIDLGANWLSVIPAWLAGMLPADTAIQAPEAVSDVLPVVEQLIHEALAQPLFSLLRGICIFVLFSIFLVLVHYIARLLSLVDRIPLVGSVNTVMGGVLGVGQAMIVLYLLAVLAQIVVAATGGGAWLNDRTLSDGYIFGFFYRL